MKFSKLLSGISVVSALALGSCQQKEVAAVLPDQVSQAALNQIHQLGFSTTNVQRIEEGYLVEGDIVLSEAQLSEAAQTQLLRVGNAGQYRTNNLVSAPRQITVSISSSLPASYGTALNEVIRRYNAEGLRLTFRRVTSGANISIVRGSGSYLASSGFPSGGAPYRSVQVNSSYLGSNPGTNYLATILAHEIGHCIGFRHTDYTDRSYSCGGQTANEGASTVGAIYIPGTSVGPDPTSWMLACIGTGQNRPFNANDRTALNYLY